jgi:hypothetical protein
VEIPADTSPEAWAAQAAILRQIGGRERFLMAFRLTHLAREASRGGIRARHPDYGEDQVKRAFFRVLHGDALTLSVWPDRELLDP